MQKKSYRMLEEMLEGNSESCKKQISIRFDEIKTLLADSLSSAKPSSKAVSFFLCNVSDQIDLLPTLPKITLSSYFYCLNSGYEWLKLLAFLAIPGPSEKTQVILNF